MIVASRGLVRLLIFWAIPITLVPAAAMLLPWVDYRLVYNTVTDAFGGEIDGVSNPGFAYALSGILFILAMGLLISFLVLHIGPVLLQLREARQLIETTYGKAKSRAEKRRSFASKFEGLRERLSRNRLIGHAWIEFEETLFDTDSDRAVGNTVRPQVFFHPALARERNAGLKMMNAVPGYFVGIGLVLTFAGLVLALYKAGAAARAGDADAMATQMGELLQIATFKFSTSIAGLGASILLSIFFRWFFVLIEGAFDRFNAVLEVGLRYHAPQSISMEISRTMQDQLVQLKDITQGDFFARMGTEIAPRVGAAISESMAPIREQIGNAIGNLTTNSQDGVQQMLRTFIESLQHGAGAEMRELATTLKQLQMTIAEMQGSVRGSGDDFASKLSDAATNLNRMVERAGQSFEESSTQSRNSLTAVVESLRQTMEKANSDLDASLGAAASGASSKLESAMSTVMGKLDAQIVAVGERFGELALAMRAIEGALTNQKAALEGASVEARRTAEAFAESATSVRTATAPLLSAGDKFTSATERLAGSVGATLEALATAKDQVSALARTLDATNATTGAFWNSFSAKFDSVDTALAGAVNELATSTSAQQQRLQDHVKLVDKGLTDAIAKLSPFLANISDSAESLADSLEKSKSVEPAE